MLVMREVCKMLRALIVALSLAPSLAHACHIQYFECNPVSYTGGAAYNTTTLCQIQVARPAGNTSCSLLSLGVHYDTNQPMAVTAVSGGLANWARITYGPYYNDTGNRLAILTGEVPLGSYSTFSLQLRVQGA